MRHINPRYLLTYLLTYFIYNLQQLHIQNAVDVATKDLSVYNGEQFVHIG